MGSARFQFFTRSAASSVEWRLISANNRDLGRCAAPLGDLVSCRLAVDRLRETIDAADEIVLQDPSGDWRWLLSWQDQAVAISSRAYPRRPECLATLVQFRRSAGDAPAGLHVRTFR